MSKKTNLWKSLSKYSVLFVVVLMVGSGIGMFIGDNVGGSEKQVFNGYEFKTIDNKWVTRINGEEHAFYYFPEELKEYCEKTSFFSKKQMGVIVINPEIKSSVLSLIRLRMENTQDFYLATGITKTADMPFNVLSCLNATSEVPFVVFERLVENKNIELEDYCITIYSDNEKERLKYGESIIYNILGVC